MGFKMEQNTISSDLIRGHIDTIILHTLLNGDKFAQQISDTIEQKSNGVYKINQATLYSSLKRLESLKFVNSYWQDSDAGGRRKFFELTASGRATVEENLSNWSFSRSIIDKLIDCEQAPIYKTEFIEKIVEVPVERTIIKEIPIAVTADVSSISKPTQPTVDVDQPKVDSIPVIQSEKVSNNQENGQDINFRNILNGLIQVQPQKLQEKTDVVELKPLEINNAETNEKPVEKQLQVQSLDQTINQKRKPIHKIDSNIDFSDLSLMAAKDGVKLRISSKYSSQSTGTLQINKLNLLNSLTVLLCLMIELFIVTSVYKNVLIIPPFVLFALLAIFFVGPLFFLVKYKKNPLATSSKKVYADSILTTVIVIFNLILINFAAVLLLNIDLSVEINSLYSVVIPVMVYFDVLAYSISNFFFANRKYCNIKNV